MALTCCLCPAHAPTPCAPTPGCSNRAPLGIFIHAAWLIADPT